ncbi:glycosyltransferase family 1 protein [Lampropedia puyangensis]|uniref:Glycosyltransferase family 1 protein n=1 Tax=Lampropedia puyangensis TaxID=1330072 RepID=A0A4S8EQW8_9BURK|nr:glycosyltransferase family 1 protein [Lampropedia puyangensis]THT96460.1 glycosyltransferase family 1 protein [Lampropedia puyangensis]
MNQAPAPNTSASSAPDLRGQHQSLRICLVTETFPPEVNGVAMTAGRVVNGLLAAGHKVHIVRPRQPEEDRAHLASFADLPTTLVHGVGVPGYNGIRFGLPAGNALERAWRHQTPDVVHVLTEGPLGYSAVKTAQRLGLPIVGGYHTHFDRYTEHYRFGFLRQTVTNYLVRFHNRCHINLAPTQELAQSLMQQGMKEVRVMSRGVDRSLFHPQHRSTALRTQWGVGKDDLVLLCVGRLAAEKQLDWVVRAWQAVRQDKPYSKLVLVGGGPEYQRLASQYPDVILTGPVSSHDLGAHYASADLFVFASMSETFGNVVQEALASGVPVVGFDYAAARELIHHDVNGVLVPFGDQQAFIQATVQAASQPAHLRQMARQAAETGRSWKSVLQDLIANYHDAIDLASIVDHRTQGSPHAHSTQNVP